MHVYVHIPFCDSICYYCDFCRTVSKDHKPWLKRILEEINTIPLRSIDTLYFGGGTPSSLKPEEFERLSKPFLPYLQPHYEWTVECNPENITAEKIALYTQLGVNRISLGVQSFDDRILKKIGRKHHKAQILKCIAALHQAGITNISIDLMYGLPDQSLEDVQSDLASFLELDIDHLSIYSLQIEPNSLFGKKEVEPCEEELEADMYETIRDVLTSSGFEHYEISSYARNKRYSRHNLCYWSDADFVGIGCGASGRLDGKRYDNTRSLPEYLQKGAHRYYVDTTIDEQAFEAIMMSLRTQFGLNIDQWNRKYHQDFIQKYQMVLKKYRNYLTIEDAHVICNERGMEILNSILVDFL